MMRKLNRRTLLAVAALALSAPAVAQAQTPILLKIGSATINEQQHEWMKIFARAVEANSGGQIKVELYPASQLGSIPRMIEGTQLGSVQAWIGPPEFLTGIDSRFAVLGAPNVFKDTQHAQRALADPEFSAAYASLGGNKGLRAIGLYATSPAIFAFRSKVDDLAGFKGKKIRVFASAWQTEPLKSVGAAAVPMSLAEVLPALQQGTLDGVMSTISVFTSLRFYDAAPYAIDAGQAQVSIVTVASKRWYDGLTPALQKVVDDAGKQASREIVAYNDKYLVEADKIWLANKSTMASLSAADQAKVKELLASTAQRVTEGKPEERAMYELMVKAAKATEK